jgi:hypothetical protein
LGWEGGACVLYYYDYDYYYDLIDLLVEIDRYYQHGILSFSRHGKSPEIDRYYQHGILSFSRHGKSPGDVPTCIYRRCFTSFPPRSDVLKGRK